MGIIPTEKENQMTVSSLMVGASPKSPSYARSSVIASCHLTAFSKPDDEKQISYSYYRCFAREVLAIILGRR